MPAALATQFYTQQVQFTLTTLVINTLKPVDQQYVALSCDTDGAYPAGYRFGFNGKEKDNEIAGAGNSQDYGARQYDPRLGRFKSVDPLAPHYPWNSTYAFAENTPIQAIDLDGEERYHYTMSLDKQGRTQIRFDHAENIKDRVWNWGTFSFKTEVNKKQEYVVHTGRFHTGAVNGSLYNQEITFTYNSEKAFHDEAASLSRKDIQAQDRNLTVLDGVAAGLQNMGEESGRGVGMGALRAKVFRSGSGPAPGVIEVSGRSISSKAFKNWKGTGVEFIYDSERKIFVMGRIGGPGSPHQNLVNSVGSKQGTNIVGGTVSRQENGNFQFTENSGHFGENWTPQKRQEFSDFMQKNTGINVDNQGYKP